MAIGNMGSMILTTAVRIAAWILPQRRKDWAEAMLNEIVYVRSRRIALRWAIGSTLCAIKERVFYELEKIFMRREILRVLLGLSAVFVVAMIGMYAIQKPYQRERIKLAILHAAETSSTDHTEAHQ